MKMTTKIKNTAAQAATIRVMRAESSTVRAAPADGSQRDDGNTGPEGEQRHDAAVECAGRNLAAHKGNGRRFRARPKQRGRDEKRRQQKENLAGGEHHR